MAESKTKKVTFKSEYIENSPAFSLEIPKNVPKKSVVKWYQQKMNYEEKFRLGLLTYPEYVEWQNELMQEKESESGSDGAASGSTFWSDDDELRTNISNDDYNDFLSQNNIDVSNRNTLDIEKLKNDLE